MWRPCPRLMGKTSNKFLVFDVQDIVGAATVFVITKIFCEHTTTIFLTGVALGGLYFFKRGKPRGWLLHVVHWLELPQTVGLTIPGLVPSKRQQYSPWSQGNAPHQRKGSSIAIVVIGILGGLYVFGMV